MRNWIDMSVVVILMCIVSGCIGTEDNNSLPTTSALLAVNEINPGTFESYPPWILYDATQDTSSGCRPYLDSQMQPVSFPLGTKGAWVIMSTIDLQGHNYQLQGTLSPDLFFLGGFHVNCHPTFNSGLNPDPNAFSGGEWITGLYKIDQMSVVGIVHNEFYGGLFPQNGTWTSSSHCPGVTDNSPLLCTYGAVKTAISNDGGNNFTNDSPIAIPDFPYNAGYIGYVWNGIPATWTKITGYFINSNIIRGNDNYYYMMHMEFMPDGSTRVCPARTLDITNPSQWRAWDGTQYTVNISAGADCTDIGAPVSPMYLGYNIYFKSYILLGSSPSLNQDFAYAISPDLIHWSQPVDLRIAPSWVVNSNSWGNYNYVTLLDPGFLINTDDMNQSSDAVSGQNPWLLYVDQKGSNGEGSRLMAEQIHFSPVPQPIPSISSMGLGCDDMQCIWIKGFDFTTACQVSIIAPDWSQRESVPNPNCSSNNYVTFRIPSNFYNSYSSIYVVVTNSFGLWNNPAWIAIK